MICNIFIRANIGRPSPRRNMATEYIAPTSVEWRFAFSDPDNRAPSWQADPFRLYVALSREPLRNRANVCPRTKSIHWRGDLTCSAVARPATAGLDICLRRFLSAHRDAPAENRYPRVVSRSDRNGRAFVLGEFSVCLGRQAFFTTACFLEFLS